MTVLVGDCGRDFFRSKKLKHLTRDKQSRPQKTDDANEWKLVLNLVRSISMPSIWIGVPCFNQSEVSFAVARCVAMPRTSETAKPAAEKNASTPSFKLTLSAL